MTAKRTPPRSRSLASTAREDALFARVVGIIESARGQVTRSVNTAMVQAYWLIGREIVEVEQHGETRAGYGQRVVDRLSKRLTARLGKGYSAPNLRNMRQFFLTFPTGSALPAELAPQIRSALPSKSRSTKIRSAAPSKSIGVGSAPFPPNLGWTHYATLMRVANTTARAFYEIDAVREGWSSRELERQSSRARS
jgi:hypothetical protein